MRFLRPAARPYRLAAFFLPVIFMLAAFAVSGIAPFGGLTMLRSDMRHQYFDLTVAFADAVKHGASIFITHKSDFGINLYAWASYLVFSPFSLLFLFFDRSAYPAVYSLIYLLKLGLASLFAYIYFCRSKIINADKKASLAFAVLYSLGMFCIVCSINIMWLDNVALLPLCFLFAENITSKKGAAYFTAVYFLCIVTNYYLSYITGVSVLIYLLYFSAVSTKDKKQILSSVFALILSVLFSIGLAAFVIVPNICAVLRDTAFDGAGTAYLSRFDPVSVCRGMFFIVNDSPVQPVLHIMFGLAPIYFTGLYFAAPKRERLAALSVSLFFILCYMIKPLYLLMHFFHAATGFFGRFAYAAAFMNIIFALRMTSRLKDIGKKAFLAPALIFAAGLSLALIKGISLFYILQLVIAVLFFAAYTLMFFAGSSGKNTSTVLCCAVLCEALIISVFGTYTLTAVTDTAAENEIVGYMQKTEPVFDALKKRDGGFFRAYDKSAPTELSNMSIGYNSTAAFSSNANKPAGHFAALMGMHVNSEGKNINNSDNTLFSDCLFNVKYILPCAADDTKGARPYNYGKYRERLDINGRDVYENKYVLPLMFTADERAISCGSDLFDEMTFTGFFKNHETVLNALTGQNGALYDMLAFDTAEQRGCTLTPNTDGTYTVNIASPDGIAALCCKYTVQSDGEYYTNFYIKSVLNDISGDKNGYIININGNDIPNDLLKENFIKDLGYYKKGEIIEVNIITAKNGLELVMPALLTLKDEYFVKCADEIKDRGLKNITDDKGVIKADAVLDTDSFIFTTIAYDDGYRIFADGSEIKKIKAANAFLGFYLPAGSHSIRIEYISPGFKTGLTVSIIFLIIAALLQREKIYALFNRKTDRTSNIGSG